MNRLLGLVNHGWRRFRAFAGAAKHQIVLLMVHAKMNVHLKAGPIRTYQNHGQPTMRAPLAADNVTFLHFAGPSLSISLAQFSTNEVYP